MENRKKVYFCPYCLAFFDNNEDKYMGGYCYKCYDPEQEDKKFTEEDFKNSNFRSKQYLFKNAINNNKEKVIDIIKDLYSEGKTQKEIIKLTHFPRRLVYETVKELLSEFKMKELSTKEFCEKYLQISNEEYDYISEHKCLNHTLNRGIKNAKQFGCSTRCIKKLFRVSERVASNASLKSLDRKGANSYCNRVVIKDYKVTIQWLNPKFIEKLKNGPKKLYVRYIKNANNMSVINKNCREYRKVELSW